MVKPDSPEVVEMSGELYPIREVSRITGVNSVTLRAWERRYGLIVPLRTGKGHRLYNNDHIARITAITDWINRGVPVGKVKTLLQQASVKMETVTEEYDEEWQKYQKDFIVALRSFDEPHIDSIYSSALRLYPVEVVTERMLKPVLDYLAREWTDKQETNAERGFLYSYLRNCIGSRVYHASMNNQGPLILCVNCPEDQDEINSWLLALSVCGSSGRARLLPSGVSLYDIGMTAVRSGCDAILLHSHKALQRETIERELPSLARVVQKPVAISGQCTSIHKDALKYININVLGDNPDCSARKLLGVCQV